MTQSRQMLAGLYVEADLSIMLWSKQLTSNLTVNSSHNAEYDINEHT